MKKFKLFALAAFAMLSTNAMAAVVTHSNGTFTYTYDAADATVDVIITGFVAELPAANQQTVVIPTQVYKQDNTTKINVTMIGKEAFKGNTNIQTVTIPDTNVKKIGSGAFNGCTSLTTVTIGKAVTTIGTDASSGAFEGCTSLATVNFTARGEADPALATLEAGTFKETVIATLDLTGTKMTTLNKLFEDLNTTLTSVKLPATLTTIKDGAFASLALLPDTGIDWSACDADLTIGDGAAGVFAGSPLIKTVTLPAKVVAIAKNALANSNIQSLTITSNATAGAPTIKEVGATKLTTLTVKGAFKGVIGDNDATKPAFTSLTTVTFESTVAAGAITKGAFSSCTKLATVNFNGDLAAKAVLEGAFAKQAGDTYALTVNYPNATDESPVNPFEDDAFSAAGAEGNYATLVTTTAFNGVFKAEDGAAAHSNTANVGVYSLKVSAPEELAETANLKVFTKGSSKYYYAKFISSANYKIQAKQDGATVVVYGAYADTDGTIYMENLKIIGGFYCIPANTPVIVKSTSNADVVVTALSTADDSRMKDAAGNWSNKISVKAANTTGLAVKDATTDGYETYFLAPIADYGFKWSKFKDERIIYGNVAANQFKSTTGEAKVDFLIECKIQTAGARIKVVWLDGSEDETTAIQTVKTVAEDGAIYNLAGQKVNASYKGVVIKDGKKYIQK